MVRIFSLGGDIFNKGSGMVLFLGTANVYHVVNTVVNKGRKSMIPYDDNYIL